MVHADDIGRAKSNGLDKSARHRVRFTWRTWNLTTHRIEADVDEARDYLLEDLYMTRFLSAIGYVEGVAAAARRSREYNLTGDPYYTDGRRAIAVLVKP